MQAIAIAAAGIAAASARFEANVSVLKTADEMTGTLLDILA